MNEGIFQEKINLVLENEKKYNLFGIKYKNKYPIWPYYRMYFWSELIKKFIATGTKGESQYKINFRTISKFFKLLSISKLSLCFIPQKKSFLIISSSRVVNGEEIYTKDLKNTINNDYVELRFSNRFIGDPGPIYLDFFKVVFKIITLITHKLLPRNADVDEFMSVMYENNEKKWGFYKYKIEYVLWYKFYWLILKIQKPKKIFFVSGVYFTPMIAAAQNIKIEVYEIQHGVINKNHLAYQFPDVAREGFYSDGILLLSSYWQNKAEFPLGTKTYVIGNDYYANSLTNGKKEKSIVILGQGPLAAEIIKFISINLNFFISNGLKVFYKLHPAEIPNWESRYKTLFEYHQNNLLTVITNSPPLTELLSTCKIIIGVSSTAIYEGLDRDCTAFILDLPSSEYFDDLVEKGVVKKIKSEKILSLDDLNFTPQPIGKFFSPTNHQMLKYIAYTTVD